MLGLWLFLALVSCTGRRVIPDVGPRPVLSVPEVVARGVVGVKDVHDNWRVDIFVADGQRWSVHSEHFFYHAHVGDRVRVVRYGAKLLLELEDR